NLPGQPHPRGTSPGPEPAEPPETTPIPAAGPGRTPTRWTARTRCARAGLPCRHTSRATKGPMPTPRTPAARGGQAPIWTRDFILATVTNLLLATSFMATIVTMAPYAVQEMGASEPQAGAVA